MSIFPTFRWPYRTLPCVTLAGRFPLDVSAFRCRYVNSTQHALHLHEYRGRIRLGRYEKVLEPGDVTISPAGHVSSYDLDGAGYHLCIHFYPVKATVPICHLPCHLSLGPRSTYLAQ